MSMSRRCLSLIFLLIFLVVSLPAGADEKKTFVYLHGDREKPQIALTVDDCYNIDHVKAVLDLCEEHQVPVTFFVVGQVMSPKHRDVWQRAIDLDCEIGNHTWSHRKLSKLSAGLVKQQLTMAAEAVDEALGYHYPMQMMRPPYGSLTKKPGYISEKWMNDAIASCGYFCAVKWDVSQTNAQKAFKDVRNGSILLYHAKPKDVACLTELIPLVKEAGFECVTVSNLLGYENPVPEKSVDPVDEPAAPAA